MSHVGISPKAETTNSDIAFWGDLAYAGNYDGFRIVDVSNPSQREQLVDYPCYGPQNDVGVWDTATGGCCSCRSTPSGRTTTARGASSRCRRRGSHR